MILIEIFRDGSFAKNFVSLYIMMRNGDNKSNHETISCFARKVEKFNEH